MTRKPLPPSRPPSAPAGGRKPSDLERALALRDVMDHAVQVQKEITAATPIRRSRASLIAALAICLPLLALTAYSLIQRPEAVWGPRPELPERREEAGLRVAMYLLAHRIDSRRAADGHYAASLEDLGEAVPHVEFTVLSDTVFELRARLRSGRAIVLVSTDPLEAFLGNSETVIQERGR